MFSWASVHLSMGEEGGMSHPGPAWGRLCSVLVLPRGGGYFGQGGEGREVPRLGDLTLSPR